MVTPFDNQILVLEKQKQVLLVRQKIYMYLMETGEVNEDDARRMAKGSIGKAHEKQGFNEDEVKQINHLMDSIVELEREISRLQYSLVFS